MCVVLEQVADRIDVEDEEAIYRLIVLDCQGLVETDGRVWRLTELALTSA
jgi:hypothetical protein